ncbi:hypothetical protein BKA69DRAFT_786106 [Paraphysoderma sedebokerense]|nr:hypothetical protein BKA69DRAFT_786106 [Paraphysoderma sedebokerense]
MLHSSSAHLATKLGLSFEINKSRKQHDEFSPAGCNDLNRLYIACISTFIVIMQEDQRIRITPDISLELSCSTDQLPIECRNSFFLCLDFELRKHEQDVALKVEETRLRELTFQRLQCLIRTAFNGKYEVRKFGSSITGLELSDSDIDVILYDTEAQSAACEKVKASNVMKKLNYFLPIIGKEFDSLPMIKIPILKYRDKVTNINVDICFKEALGTEGTNYILQQLDLYPNLYRPFIIFWKSHLKNLHEIGDTAKGGLASFTIMMMLTFLLKVINLNGRM